MTSEINYEDLELRALAHMAIGYGPRMKSVFVDREAVRELSRRQAVYHGHDWDPAPPLRMGPQRCLSSRETIGRLAFVLPKEPDPMSEAISRAWSRALLYGRPMPDPEDSPVHWRDIFARDFPKTRHVWMGGDYIDDGTGRPPTKEEALQRFKEMLEAVRQAPVVGAYYPPHTRDTKPRG